jgi:predicted DNA-binding protein (MmcQ/YjbR family)
VWRECSGGAVTRPGRSRAASGHGGTRSSRWRNAASRSIGRRRRSAPTAAVRSRASVAAAAAAVAVSAAVTKGAAARPNLLAHALSLPGAWLDHPWGEDVAKVGKKVFVFFGRKSPEIFVGVKLSRSLLYARSRPFTKRFGYGLDDAGWVARRFAKNDHVPLALLEDWIDESFEAVAPKRARRP